MKPEANALAYSAAIIEGEKCQQRIPTVCLLRVMQRSGMQADETIYNASISDAGKGQQWITTVNSCRPCSSGA